ncbi:MAG TPA: hypothetical protein VL084_01865 [Thermoanaerobaculia bacterium]|nr:hypothetical protein [Thermoanaerobaculia bacterium]
MKRALTVSLAAALLAAAPAGAQSPGNPTLFERYAQKLQNNPALGKLVEAPPGGIEKLKWMVGTWDATSRRYATPSLPERVQKGTRKTSYELKGWWLASIDDIGDLKAASLITEDPYSQKLARLFLSSWGGGLARPMISSSGLQDGNVAFEGAIVLFGDAVNVRLRISKADENTYYEVWEEKVLEDQIVPIFEVKLTRQKPKPAPAK